MMLKTDLWFPDVEESTEEGIVAVGGDLYSTYSPLWLNGIINL